MKKFLLLFPTLVLTVQLFAQKTNTNLLYIENKGQWQSSISHMTKINGGLVWLEKNQLSFSFIHHEDAEAIHEMHHGKKKAPETIRTHHYRLSFIQPNTEVKIDASKKIPSYYNYFIGSDATKWATNVGLFEEVIYSNLFNGIDLKLHSATPYLKYDYIVHAGADVNQIKWKYEGIAPTIKDGKIILNSSVGEIIEDKPIAWQVINGLKTEVECNYKLIDGILQFEFPNGYQVGYDLVIDPTLIFSTFSGALDDNWGYSATYDNNGNLYGGGISFGGNYPFSVGAFQTAYGGGTVDATISKFNSTGTNLIYSTILGGNSSDAPHSLVVDANDNLYVYGSTGSSNFPTTSGCYDNSFNGGPTSSFNSLNYSGADIFITCFNSTGTALIGSTFVGGSDLDGINDGSTYFNYGDYNRGEIILANNGDVLVASTTNSTNFPTTAGSASQTNAGAQEAIAFRMNPSLTNLIWSTYNGGSNDDAGYGIKESGNGTIYMTGGTSSTNFPITAGALQTSYGGGPTDGYITSLNGTTGARVNATFLGTTATGNSGYDQCYFIEIDKSNDIYVVGQTKGNWPVTPGVYSNNNGRQFIHKLNPTLSATEFSTRFGSGGTAIDISPTAFLVDNCYNIYVSGWGGSLNSEGDVSGMPVTADANDATTNGNDFYFIVLERDAASLLYGSYFGGSDEEHVDGGTSRFDKKGNIYQGICGGCNGGIPTTPGAVSSTSQGDANGCNLAVFKMEFNYLGIVADANAAPNIIACDPPYDVNFTGGTAVHHIWNFDDGSPNSTSQNPSHTFTGIGTYNVMYIAIDSSTCNIADTAYVTVEILQSETFAATLDVGPYNPCTGGPFDVSLEFTGSGADSLIWDMGDGTIYNDTIVNHIYSSAGQYIISMTAYDLTCGNVGTIIDTVDFNPNSTSANANASPNIIACDPPYDVNFTGSNNPNHIWDFDDGSPVSNQQNPSHTFTAIGTYNVMYIAIDSSTCNIADTVYLTVEILQAEVFSATLDIGPYDPCTGGPFDVTLEFTGSGADSLVWDMGDGNIYNDTIVNHAYGTDGTYIITMTAYDFTCGNVGTITDTVTFNSNNAVANANASPNVIACDPPFIVNYTGGSTPDHYWDFGDGVGTSTLQNPSYTFTALGTYNVMYVGIDSSTCNIADTVYLTVEVLEAEEFSAEFSPIPPQPCSDTVLVNVNFTGTGADSLIWNMGDGTIFTDNTVINYLYTVPGTYTLTLTAFDFTCGHVGSISQTIEVAENVVNGIVFVPNVFSPNGDNVNEEFKIGYSNYPNLNAMDYLDDYHVQIYNRWGKLVFEGNVPWNGKMNNSGDQLSEGVYYYILHYQRTCLDTETTETHGYVTLLRN